MLNFVKSWLGLNIWLPYTSDVKNPTHGQKAKNIRQQKVIWDATQDKWVMPQNFSDAKPVSVRKDEQ